MVSRFGAAVNDERASVPLRSAWGEAMLAVVFLCVVAGSLVVWLRSGIPPAAQLPIASSGVAKKAPGAQRRDGSESAAGTAASEVTAGGADPASQQPEMILHPGGRFRSASGVGYHLSDSTPVYAKRFWLDRLEVSVGEFAACVSAGRCRNDRVGSRESCNEVGDAAVALHPINCVTWEQAMAFCRWRSKRLPTTVEWEYAAVGGSEQRTYAWGDASPNVRNVNGRGREWGHHEADGHLGYLYDEADPFLTTAPVDSYPLGASRWGVLHLADNVSEWASDKHPWGHEVNGACFGDSYSRLYESRRRTVGVESWSAGIGFRCAKDGPE